MTTGTLSKSPGNLEGILEDGGQLPAGRYWSVVSAARLKSGDNIYAEVIFEVIAPEKYKGRFISEKFALMGDEASYPRRSKRALTQIAADAGIEDLRDLRDLVGKNIRFDIVELEGKKGQTVIRMIFPRPAEAWMENADLSGVE